MINMHCIVLLLLLPLRKKDRPPVSGARYTWTILDLDLSSLAEVHVP